MIYLIGGAPRVGKSQLTQKFIEAKEYNLPYFDLAKDYDTKVQLALQSLLA